MKNHITDDAVSDTQEPASANLPEAGSVERGMHFDASQKRTDPPSLAVAGAAAALRGVTHQVQAQERQARDLREKETLSRRSTTA